MQSSAPGFPGSCSCYLLMMYVQEVGNHLFEKDKFPYKKWIRFNWFLILRKWHHKTASQHSMAITPEFQAQQLHICFLFSCSQHLFPRLEFSPPVRWYCISPLPLPLPQTLALRLSQAVKILKEETYGLDICCSEDRTGTPTQQGCCECRVCDVSCASVCVCRRFVQLLEHWLHCSKAVAVTANLPSSVMLFLCPGCSGFGGNMPGWQEGMKSSSSSRRRRWNFMSVNSSLRRSDWGSNSYLQHVFQGRLNMRDRNRTVVISLPRSTIWS